MSTTAGTVAVKVHPTAATVATIGMTTLMNIDSEGAPLPGVPRLEERMCKGGRGRCADLVDGPCRPDSSADPFDLSAKVAGTDQANRWSGRAPTEPRGQGGRRGSGVEAGGASGARRTAPCTTAPGPRSGKARDQLSRRAGGPARRSAAAIPAVHDHELVSDLRRERGRGRDGAVTARNRGGGERSGVRAVAPARVGPCHVPPRPRPRSGESPECNYHGAPEQLPAAAQRSQLSSANHPTAAQRSLFGEANPAPPLSALGSTAWSHATRGTSPASRSRSSRVGSRSSRRGVVRRRSRSGQ